MSKDENKTTGQTEMDNINHVDPLLSSIEKKETEIDNLKYKMKSLENIIADLTLIIEMYIGNYPFDDNDKVNQKTLIDNIYVVVKASPSDRKKVLYLGHIR